MTREKGIIKAITGASFIMVVLLTLIYLYSQSFTASPLFPENTGEWNVILTGYLVILSLSLIGAIILIPDTVRKLGQANYWKSFLFKFIPAFVVSFIVLTLLQSVFKGPGAVDIFSRVAYMKISVLIVHAFVITQVEELLFGGLIFTSIEKKNGSKSANIITVILFALFHYAKAGGSIPIMLTYIPLRFIFNYARNNGIPFLRDIPKIGEKFFGPTPATQQSNAGVHFAWNAFIILR